MSTQERPNALDPEVLECPFPFYAQLHAEGNAAFNEGMAGFLVPGYDDLVTVAKDTATFSNQVQGPEGMRLLGTSPEPLSPEVEKVLEGMHEMANVLFFSDPPNHTRTRVLATKALNAKRVREMEPLIDQIVTRLIDAFIDDGHCDLKAQFAVPLPANLMGAVLGVDAADIEDFKKWSDDAAIGIAAPLNNEQRVVVLQSMIEFQQYLLERIEQRRAEPAEDLLSAIVHAELELEDLKDEDVDLSDIKGPRTLNNAEIITIVIQLLSGGNHTTTDLVATAIKRLIDHPDVMAEVRADYDLIPALLEETLRIESPVQCTYRVTTAPVTLRDTEIPAGSMVGVNWGAAGHDPDQYPDPTKFDIHRPNLKRHLSFGHGKHFCVGSNIARVEARMALTALLDRLDDIALAPGTELKHELNYAFNTLEGLPITFTKKR